MAKCQAPRLVGSGLCLKEFEAKESWMVVCLDCWKLGWTVAPNTGKVVPKKDSPAMVFSKKPKAEAPEQVEQEPAQEVTPARIAPKQSEIEQTDKIDIIMSIVTSVEKFLGTNPSTGMIAINLYQAIKNIKKQCSWRLE